MTPATDTRQALERAVEALIAVLDSIEPDPRTGQAARWLMRLSAAHPFVLILCGTEQSDSNCHSGSSVSGREDKTPPFQEIYADPSGRM